MNIYQRNLKKISYIVLLLISLLTVMAACDNKPDVVGKWEIIDKLHTGPFSQTIEFLKDGTYVLADSSSGKYSFLDENKKLQFNFGGVSAVCDFKLENGQMILTASRTTAKFNKVK
ncbi:hypothetical protein [Paenibacillus tyrfis]|uniref:hypothetical protein n=1 Tax=Paenibacillus tyrfis TaxID=1501230 RepID=UPI00209CA028|nr:hypothetical protein [Paenibacillus tyrfis]MCP1312078.1 hypothetical protein [Paenibacillus tyrfis]